MRATCRALRADALTGAGILAAAQGDHAAAVRYHEQSLRIHEELGELQSIQYALHNLANATLHQGNLDERASSTRSPRDGDRHDPHGSFVRPREPGRRHRRTGRIQRGKRALRAGPIDDRPRERRRVGGGLCDGGLRSGRRPTRRHVDRAQRYEQALTSTDSMGDQRAEAES